MKVKVKVKRKYKIFQIYNHVYSLPEFVSKLRWITQDALEQF